MRALEGSVSGYVPYGTGLLFSFTEYTNGLIMGKVCSRIVHMVWFDWVGSNEGVRVMNHANEIERGDQPLGDK